ncbi:molybdopterin-dependent oxidoreductase [Rubinisphaera italica]|uniref:Oxidoreductase molybdopterin binding domain protein n=1 Tax=Rubinisphaera italica TaxID=2527969 RepID=A0A5C5XGQ9_9PLAN|nr:molybdopterin-dependent oxidoreductase [Rubinisphaera italica]TWT62170.1 Oxidoreductase molybdopterin binding domain protein [Rubinisphaera italica]
MKILITIGSEVSIEFDRVKFVQFPHEYQVPDISKFIPGRPGRGLKFRSLLESLKPEGVDIELISLKASHDQFEKSIQWQLIPVGAVLVYEIHGEEIPLEKGGPFRLYVPGTVVCGQAELDNCVNIKHLDRIDVELVTV